MYMRSSSRMKGRSLSTVREPKIRTSGGAMERTHAAAKMGKNFEGGIVREGAVGAKEGRRGDTSESVAEPSSPPESSQDSRGRRCGLGAQAYSIDAEIHLPPLEPRDVADATIAQRSLQQNEHSRHQREGAHADPRSTNLNQLQSGFQLTRLMSLPGAFAVPGISAAEDTPRVERGGATDESLVHRALAFSVTDRGDGSIARTSRNSSRTNLTDRVVEHVRQMARNAPLVEVVSITDTQYAESSSGWKAVLCGHRVMCIILATVFVAAAAAGSAAAVTIMRRRRENTAAAGNPGANPFVGAARFEELRRVVSAVSDEGDLSDPTSPQFAALSWLANEDELLPSPLQDAEAVIQRYVMALFYVSTGGENWAGNNLFEAASTHCMHWSTTCWEMLEGIEMERMGPGRPYLSNALHECQWEGVGCYEGTDVVGAISILNNSLTGEIPQELGALKLQELHLSRNQIGGTFPKSIQDLGCIKSIILSYNLLTGTIPDIFSTLPNLTYFGCSVNLLSGTIPKSLNGHKNLKKFYAAWSGLSGTIPLDFNTMPSLEVIMLDGNALSGPIPPSISGWSNAVYLGLSRNQLTGTIPDFLDGLSGLKVLHLTENHLSGTIPSSLLDLKNLVSLALGDNYLTGTTPENLGDAMSLQSLSLENNGLTGTIPASVGDLKDLWLFRAHSNGFTGTIPATLGDNPPLRFLELGDNKLVGTFPDTFESAFTLEHLDLSKNDLTGNLSFLCDLDIPFMYADCGGQKAEVDCDCCLFCCSDAEEIAGCDNYISTLAFGVRYCTDKGLGSIICGGD